MFLKLWEQLPEDIKYVATIVGIEEGFLANAIFKRPPEQTNVQKQKIHIHHRFLISLVLHDLVKELPLNLVSKKYCVSKGLIQNLQSAVGMFAGMVTMFSAKLGWANMEILLSKFQNRLIFGIERELCELVKISLLNGFRARILYNAGYHTLNSLASATSTAIEDILRKASPYQRKLFSNVHNSIPTVWCRKLKKSFTESEAARLIIQQAQDILCLENNIPIFAWASNDMTLEDGISKRDLRKLMNKLPTSDIPTPTKFLKIAPDTNEILTKNKQVCDIHAENGSSEVLTTQCKTNIESDLFELSVQHTSVFSESGMQIIDVTADKSLFEVFLSECVEQEVIAFSIATQNIHNQNVIGPVIGQVQSIKGLPIAQSNHEIIGIAFNWGTADVYYISLCDCSTSKETDPLELGCYSCLSIETRLTQIKSIFENGQRYKFVAYDVKKQIKQLIMSKICSNPIGTFSDPKVADWLLNPDADEKNLHNMSLLYLSNTLQCDENIPLSSLATHSPFPFLKASAECLVAFMLMQNLGNILISENLFKPFTQVEMPAIVLLAKIEANGIGISVDDCNRLLMNLKSHLKNLESEIYKLAGRPVALTSRDDVSALLFTELKLPSFQSPIYNISHGTGKIQHPSTSKKVLEKLSKYNRLPVLILEWRRISNTVAKALYPLIKASVTYSDTCNGVHHRVYSTCEFHTATGRLSFCNPNIQNTPHEYIIDAEQGCNAVEYAPNIAVRKVFHAYSNCVFVAADYCQLELRLLAHLSKDIKLQKFLCSEQDPFCLIAGEWLNIDAMKVTSQQRQQAKQICYGIIYGVGNKTLADQLTITEAEACSFIDTFKSKYLTMHKFLTEIVDQCRKNGFIKTISGKKRYLPKIHSPNITIRAQAERQAVNSTIQGSAADLVKKAMCNIDIALQDSGLQTIVIHPNNLSCKRALLVLQLHDELLYEIQKSQLDTVARIIKQEMENVLPNSLVKLLVRIKSGTTWDNMTDYNMF